MEVDIRVPHSWIVEPSRQVANEPVHHFKHTTLGILTLIQEMTDFKLETVDANTVPVQLG